MSQLGHLGVIDVARPVTHSRQQVATAIEGQQQHRVLAANVHGLRVRVHDSPALLDGQSVNTALGVGGHYSGTPPR